MGQAAGQQITKQQLAVFGASLRDPWDRPFAPSVSSEYDGVSGQAGGVVGWMYPWMGNGFLNLMFLLLMGFWLYPGWHSALPYFVQGWSVHFAYLTDTLPTLPYISHIQVPAGRVRKLWGFRKRPLTTGVSCFSSIPRSFRDILPILQFAAPYREHLTNTQESKRAKRKYLYVDRRTLPYFH